VKYEAPQCERDDRGQSGPGDRVRLIGRPAVPAEQIRKPPAEPKPSPGIVGGKALIVDVASDVVDAIRSMYWSRKVLSTPDPPKKNLAASKGMASISVASAASADQLPASFDHSRHRVAQPNPSGANNPTTITALSKLANATSTYVPGPMCIRLTTNCSPRLSTTAQTPPRVNSTKV
jgi:hypothetical protein